MQHLGAGIDLLVAVGDGDRVELAARIVAAQDAARILPGDRRAGLELRPGDLRVDAAAQPALGDEIVDAAAALGVAGIPVLDGGILDLGVVERDELDHRGVQLVLVAHGRGAALEIAHIGALVGDDERAFELAGVALVDAEIGGQLERAADAGRDVDEGGIGEHCRVERREEIVGDRHHGAEIFLHQVGMLLQRLGNRAEDHARLGELRLEGGGDRHGVEHRIDRHTAVAVAAALLVLVLVLVLALVLTTASGLLDAEQRLPLAQRDAELLVGLEDLGIDLVERLRSVLLLGRGVVIDVLVIDRGVGHARPAGLAHGQPAPIGVEPPGEHPLGLVLLRRDEADNVFGKALRGLVGFDIRDESVLVLVDVDAANLLDGLLYGRHSSLRCGFKDRGLDQSVMVVVASGVPSPSLLLQAAMPSDLLSSAADTLIQAWTKRSTSGSVVVGPRLTRTAARASCGGAPIAASTWDGWTLPEEQAAPEDTATPSRSKAMTAVSAFMPGTANRVVFGSRSTPAPKMTTSGVAACSAVSRRSRSAAVCALSAAREARAAVAAAPKPAMPATFSVPARTPRSCPPPLMKGSGNGTSALRLISAPTPLGAPILCPEMVRSSAPSALISHAIRPAPWTASTCSRPPASCVRRAASETG